MALRGMSISAGNNVDIFQTGSPQTLHGSFKKLLDDNPTLLNCIAVKDADQRDTQLTFQQLQDWGVKFHQLVLGKIYYDILIDDKVVNSLQIKDLESVEQCLK